MYILKNFLIIVLLMIFHDGILAQGTSIPGTLDSVNNLNRVRVFNQDGDRIEKGILGKVDGEYISILKLKKSKLTESSYYHIQDISELRINKGKNKGKHYRNWALVGFSSGFISGFIFNIQNSGGGLGWGFPFIAGGLGAINALTLGVLIPEPHVKIKFGGRTNHEKQMDKLKNYQIEY